MYLCIALKGVMRSEQFQWSCASDCLCRHLSLSNLLLGRQYLLERDGQLDYTSGNCEVLGDWGSSGRDFHTVVQCRGTHMYPCIVWKEANFLGRVVLALATTNNSKLGKVASCLDLTKGRRKDKLRCKQLRVGRGLGSELSLTQRRSATS